MQPFNPGFNNIYQPTTTPSQQNVMPPTSADQQQQQPKPVPFNPYAAPQFQQQLAPPPMDQSFAQLSLQQQQPVYPQQYGTAPPPMFQQPPPTMGGFAPTQQMMPPSPQQHQPSVLPPPPTSFGQQQQFVQQPVNYFGTAMTNAPPVNVPAANLYDISTVASPQGYQTPQVQPTMTQPKAAAPSQQQSNKIDPNQIPSPAKRKYPDYYIKKPFLSSEPMPPSAVTKYKVFDQGTCNPRFMRAACHSMPQTVDLLQNSGLIMGAIIQPLADLDDADVPNTVAAVDFQENGPIRCNRCRAYINPYVMFVDGGKRFVCNLCGLSNEVPRWYMCNLDGAGKRRDIDERPELRHGAVDFVATTKEYMPRPPVPLSYVFVIDVSSNAFVQGIVQAAVASIKSIIQSAAQSHPNNTLALITFAKTVHFYNIKGGHPKILVVGDVDDVFVPLPQNTLMTFAELAANEEFLDKLVDLASSVKENENAMGSAIVAAQKLLEGTGGRALVFSTQTPNVGQGKMTPREDYKLYGTEKERALYMPQQGFYKNTAPICAKQQICVDVFLFPNTFIEAATLAHISNVTNGHVYLYPNFTSKRDSDRLHRDMKRNIERNAGYDALLKVRCSAGLSIRRYFGHYFEQTQEEMDLAGVDADTAFAVEFKHDSALDDKLPVYIQTAMLYTHRDGTRMIRVLNMKLSVANAMSNVFKYADLDATMVMLARFAVQQVEKNHDALSIVRELIVSKATQILGNYRKFCSNGSSTGQLILPEALKLLPIYSLGLIKSPALRPGVDVLLDERIAHFNAIMKMGCEALLLYCYPRLFSLHDLQTYATTTTTENAESPATDSVAFDYPLPALQSLSAAKVNNDGVYLLDDGMHTYVWVGKFANSDVLNAIFKVGAVDEITPETLPNPDLSTYIGKRFAEILDELQASKLRQGPVRVMKEKDPFENQFYARLVEDKFYSQTKSYVEHLCQIHKDIQARLS